MHKNGIRSEVRGSEGRTLSTAARRRTGIRRAERNAGAWAADQPGFRCHGDILLLVASGSHSRKCTRARSCSRIPFLVSVRNYYSSMN